MATPRFDDIEGEEVGSAPRFDDIAGEEEGTTGTPKMGAAKAATLGVAQGGTMGFVDEIGGALATYLPRALGGVPESSVKLGPAAMPSASDTDEVLQAKANLIEGVANTPTPYELVRDKIRAEQKQAKEQQGGAYMAGEIGGGVGASIASNILVPGGGVMRSAAEGALGGLGSSEADLLGGDVLGAASDTALGGLVGAGAGYLGNKAGGYIGRKLGAAPGALEDAARERALKASGYIQKDFPKQAGPRARLMERAGLLLDEPGVITPGASAEAIGDRAGTAAREYGEDTIGALLKEADDAGASFDPRSFVQGAKDLAAEVASDPALRPQASRLAALARGYERRAAELANQGLPFTFQDANRMKGNLQAAIFNQRGDVKVNYELANRLQRLFTDEIDTQLEGTLGADAGILFRDAKMRYGALIGAAEKGAQGANRSLGNNVLGLPDYLAANAAAAAGGGPVAAAATGALANAVRGRADSAAAVALRGLSGNALLRAVAESAPGMLGEFSGPISAAIARGVQGDDSALSAVDHVLQQTSPDYRARKAALAKEAE
jgi:hypothetical protein